MAEVWVSLLAGSVLVLVGFLAAQLFNRYGLPDYAILLTIGLVLGSGLLPLGAWDPRSSLAAVAPFLMSIAIAFILFDGGLALHMRGLGRAWAGAGLHTAAAMALTLGGTWLVVPYALGLSPATALILGLAFIGPSAAIVLSFLPRLRVDERTKMTLTLEGVLGNVVAAVLVLIVVRIPGLSDGSAWLPYVAYVAGTVAVAALAGEGWARVMNAARPRSFAFMTSVALAILLYAIGEGVLGGNGGLAAFVFGLVLGRRGPVLASRWEAAPRGAAERGLQEFHRELVFLLRTFFFVYLGLLIDLRTLTVQGVLGAILLVGVFVAARWPPSAALAWRWRLPGPDARVLRATVARGLTDTVLVLFAISAGAIPAADAGPATDLLFLVVLFAAFVSAALIFRAERMASREAAAPPPTETPAPMPPVESPPPEESSEEEPAASP